MRISMLEPGAACLCASLLALMGTQAACVGAKQTQATASDEAKAAQPGLFTLPQDQLARLRVVPVRRMNWPVAVHTTGTVDWDADHTTQAITQVNGPISRILVDTGTPVKAGDPAAVRLQPRRGQRHLGLPQGAQPRSPGQAHRGPHEGAAGPRRHRRQGRTRASEADYNDARTDVQNSLQALRIFGITRQEIDEAEQQGTAIRTELAVRSPIAGVVVQKLVSPGMLIQAGSTVCFMISDVSTVWVQGHIFDRDLPLVRVGDAVEETNPSFDGNFRGTVAYIGAFVDPATRTTPVRIVTQNPEELLKKDMFVDAVIRTSTQSQRAGGAGFRRAARRQERAHGLRPGGTGQVRAALGDHRGAAGRHGGDHRRTYRKARTWWPMAASSFSSRAVSNKAETR